jgi:hypothetical protein
MLPRPNKIQHKVRDLLQAVLWGRVSSYRHMAIMDAEEALWRAFLRTKVGTFLDRKEHEANLLVLAREWGPQDRNTSAFRTAYIEASIRTMIGKTILAKAMAKPRRTIRDN